MGTFSSSAFGNDTALDWLGDFSVRKSLNKIEKALKTATTEVEESEKLLVAAELVAAINGSPSLELPEEFFQWVVNQSEKPHPKLAQLALQGINSVGEHSELSELWQDSGDYDEWIEALDELKTRLSCPHKTLRLSDLKEARDTFDICASPDVATETDLTSLTVTEGPELFETVFSDMLEELVVYPNSGIQVEPSLFPFDKFSKQDNLKKIILIKTILRDSSLDFRSFRALKHFAIAQRSESTSIEEIILPKSLTTLAVQDIFSHEEIAHIRVINLEELSSLTKLLLWAPLLEVPNWSLFPGLEYLDLGPLKKQTNLEDFHKLKRLRYLAIEDSEAAPIRYSLEDLMVLEGHPSLTHFSLRGSFHGVEKAEKLRQELNLKEYVKSPFWT